jgi:ABC transporter with metal-binding/Fe-S-binding domain ATP-binding protein
MFHHPGVKWTRLQAEAVGVPLVTAETSGVKEEELKELQGSLSSVISSYGIDCVITGAIASEYQKSRIDRICDDLGIRALAPLWRKDPARLVHEQVSMGFEFILTACMAMGLDQSWLGRLVDDVALKDLETIGRRYGFNLAFEGGEAETFVTDAPIFAKRVQISEAQPVWAQDSGYLNIIRAELAGKGRPKK